VGRCLRTLSIANLKRFPYLCRPQFFAEFLFARKQEKSGEKEATELKKLSENLW
jgi:hypothetical protein